MSKAIEDVLAERQRQISEEGFDHAYDDQHIAANCDHLVVRQVAA